MDHERIGICQYKENCQIQNCKNLHSSDQNYFYKVQMEKAKHQIKCQKNCVDFNSCLDIHENERLFIQCQLNCQNPECFFSHETNILQNEEQLQKAIEYKEQGNELFKQGNYEKAIESFDKAIKYNGQMSVLYSNKALCFKKLNLWNKVKETSIQALQLDEYNLRAKYLEAISLVVLQKQQPTSSIIEILKCNLQTLQFIEFEAENKQMHSLTNLTNEKNKIEMFIDQLKKSELDFKLIQIVENSKASSQQKENLLRFLWSKVMQQQILLKEPEPEEEIPEYLHCPITFEQFSEPILTDSGQTYERQALEYHTAKNGYIDPYTRQVLKPQYISNLQIQQAIQNLKKRNQIRLQTLELLSFQ